MFKNEFFFYIKNLLHPRMSVSPLPPDLLAALAEPTLHSEINNVVVFILHPDGSTTDSDLTYFSIQHRKVELVTKINEFAKELFDKYWLDKSDPYDKFDPYVKNHILPIDDNLRLEITFARPAEWYFTPA